MSAPVVIVGAGLAGGTAAATLREEGFEGGIVLLGREPHPPYDRPPLSKDYLRGEASREDVMLRSPGFWDEQQIRLRTGVAVRGVDTAQRRIVLADGDRPEYGSLLVATGGVPRRPDLPGMALSGVHTLRTLEDADDIRSAAGSGDRAVVVGMGFIGCEVAASLRMAGVEVTAVDPARTPLSHALGTRVGGAVTRLHEAHGVRVILGEAIERFEGDAGVDRAVTTRGRAITCDLAVVGLGIEPAVGLVAGTDVTVDDGVVVDDRCRTGVAGVHAAGDVARHHHPLIDDHLRVEHWQNALRQGAAAARSMLGSTDPYAPVPWFWSDQYDTTIQHAGFPSAWDRLVVRGDTSAPPFTAFYLRDGRLLAAASFDRPRDVRVAVRLIEARAEPDADLLADESRDLRDLLAEAGGGGAG